MRHSPTPLMRRLRIASLVLYVSVILGSLYSGFSSLARHATAPAAAEEARGGDPEGPQPELCGA